MPVSGSTDLGKCVAGGEDIELALHVEVVGHVDGVVVIDEVEPERLAEHRPRHGDKQGTESELDWVTDTNTGNHGKPPLDRIAPTGKRTRASNCEV